jgi:hypothetical protein
MSAVELSTGGGVQCACTSMSQSQAFGIQACTIQMAASQPFKPHYPESFVDLVALFSSVFL